MADGTVLPEELLTEQQALELFLVLRDAGPDEFMTKHHAGWLLLVVKRMGGDDKLVDQKRALATAFVALTNNERLRAENTRLLEALELCGAYAHMVDITEIEAVVQKALDGQPQYNPLKARIIQLEERLLPYKRLDTYCRDRSMSWPARLALIARALHDICEVCPDSKCVLCPKKAKHLPRA